MPQSGGNELRVFFYLVVNVEAQWFSTRPSETVGNDCIK